MNKLNQAGFELEWVTLQNQYDSYEKHALLIKLFSMALCTVMLFHTKLDFLFVLLLLLAWLLEGIWKTFQSRIANRILKVEYAIAQKVDDTPMQFHSDWAASRGSLVALASEYIKSCLTPTVFVPHSIIVSAGLIVAFII